jgi:hypothetical protein
MRSQILKTLCTPNEDINQTHLKSVNSTGTNNNYNGSNIGQYTSYSKLAAQPHTDNLMLTEHHQTYVNNNDGDWFNPIQPNKTLRIYHQNIRGAKTYTNWNRWKEGVDWLNQNNIGIATLCETNTTWNNKNIMKATEVAKQTTNNCLLSATSSEEIKLTDFQPGGTACLLLNHNTGYCVEKIQDKDGLGRWSGFKLKGKNNKTIIILSAYRPTKSRDLGDNTCYSQQWRLLRSKHQREPRPREVFVTDLIKLITEWENNNFEVIIGADMNESCVKAKSEVTHLLNKTTLVSLLNIDDPPATYTRGSQCIDFMFGTPNIKRATERHGYLQFYKGAWDSDHRGLFVDLNIDKLFDVPIQTPPNTRRNLTSTNWITATKFIGLLQKETKLAQIEQQLVKLERIDVLSESNKQKVDDIDKQFTEILIKAERKCKKIEDTYWSEVLHHHQMIHKYWKITAKGGANKINITAITQDLAAKLPQASDVWQGDPTRPTKHQLKRSTERLKEIRKNAWDHRKEFLIKLQIQYREVGDKKREKIIQSIRKAELRKKCISICKSINKPKGQQGGLTHIIINTDQGNVVIDNQTTMNQLLREKNITHFSQAKKTPCVEGELQRILTQNGVSKIFQQALQGKIPKNTEQRTHDILTELKQVRREMSDFIPFDAMVNGFLKWKEKTSTSPSGKHLGIYKTLIKVMNGKYEPKATLQSAKATCTEEYKQTAVRALQIQHKLMNLAIKHTITYTRWKTIHNFFIEKIPGNPLINKLRTIHLYEADWNLISKYFVAYRLHGVACREKTIRQEQTGGRPGKSAAHSATQAIITNEIILLQKLTGAVMYNDAAACFDRIVENISNATLMREGLHKNIAKLHAQTLTTANYYIKTKHGIYDNPNRHNNPEPLFGTGQGAADSMPRWGLLSDLLIRLYTKYAKSNQISGPITNTILSMLLKAYVDDTYGVTICNEIWQLQRLLTHNAQLWENLLFTIGGKLEITKCKFVIYNWTQDEYGTLTLNNNKTLGKITINESETNTPMEIEEIESTTPYKLLGIPTALHKGNVGQAEMLEVKRDRMVKLLKMAKLPHNETTTCFNTIILPTLKYGNSSTSLSQKALKDIQKPLTYTLLPKIGYNRHVPRAMVYASTAMGGIGIQNLYTEQGLAQVQYFIGEWRRNDEGKDALKCLLESYMVASGIPGNPLEHNIKLVYIHSAWLNAIQGFLREINGRIIIKNTKTFQKLRVRDHVIMERAIGFFRDKKKLEAINNIRTYLELMTFAELSNIEGTHILFDAFHGTVDAIGRPLIHKVSKSTIIWPKIPRPPPKAWRVWKKWLQNYTHRHSLQLMSPTTRWLPNDNPNRIWLDQSTNKVHTEIFNNQPTKGKKKNREDGKSNSLVNEMEYIEISVDSKTNRNNCISSWSIHNKEKVYKNEKSSTKTLPFQGSNRGLLVAIQQALHWIVAWYKSHNTIPNPGILMIWTESKKMTMILREMQYTNPTTYELTKSEADLRNQIRILLNFFPKYKIEWEGSTRGIYYKNRKIVKERTNITNHETILSHQTEIQTEIELQIDNIAVTGDIQHTIRTESTKQEYMAHLTNKYGWEVNCAPSIDWKATDYAMSNQTPTSKKFITKLIHGWLPTRGHPAYTSDTTFTNICPYCNEPDETNKHFCFCQTEREDQIDNLAQKMRGKTNIKIHTILCKAIEHHLHNQRFEIPQEYTEIAKAQQKIGWELLSMGRLTNKWADQYNAETGETTGHQYIGKIIKLCWKYHQDRWYERCEKATEENPITYNENNKLINKEIENRYKLHHKLNNIDKDLLSISITDRLQTKQKAKITWLLNTKTVFETGIKQSWEGIAKSNRKITEYFTRSLTSTAQVENNRVARDKENHAKIRKENLKPP